MNEDQNKPETAPEQTSDDGGEDVTLWEYALLLALIAIVVIVAMLYLQPLEQEFLY
jgi:hypothetical protein